MEDNYSLKLAIGRAPNINLQIEDPQRVIKLTEAVDVLIHGDSIVYYDTSDSWNQKRELIAERGALYIYSDKRVIVDEHGNQVNVPGIKIGDGSSFLIDMPFVGDDVLLDLLEHVRSNCHITEAERIFWNNKITAKLDPLNPERLLLTTN